MKHFRNTTTNEVFGYDETQQELVDAAISAGWVDVTGQWPPAPTLEERNVVVLEEIVQLEVKSLLSRPLRELLLKDTTAPGYAKVKALDDQIATLRATMQKV
jgi:hypothetical protein